MPPSTDPIDELRDLLRRERELGAQRRHVVRRQARLLRELTSQQGFTYGKLVWRIATDAGVDRTDPSDRRRLAERLKKRVSRSRPGTGVPRFASTGMANDNTRDHAGGQEESMTMPDPDCRLRRRRVTEEFFDGPPDLADDHDDLDALGGADEVDVPDEEAPDLDDGEC